MYSPRDTVRMGEIIKTVEDEGCAGMRVIAVHVRAGNARFPEIHGAYCAD